VEVRNALINQIVEEHKLKVIEGRWACSCGMCPLGTVGVVKPMEREIEIAASLFACHVLNKALDSLIAALK
jgi:hypothetical protein